MGQRFSNEGVQHLLHIQPDWIPLIHMILIYLSSNFATGPKTELHGRQAPPSSGIPTNKLINRLLLQRAPIGRLDAITPLKD